MKYNYLKTFLLFLFALVGTKTSAQYEYNVAIEADCQIDGIYYYLQGEEATVTSKTIWRSSYYVIDDVGYEYYGQFNYSSDYSGDVHIPFSISVDNKTYRVSGIAAGAFYGCTKLTSVIIPNGLTSIGLNPYKRNNYDKIYDKGVFEGCSGLTSIIIPNSVTSIGSSAFKGCSGLTSIIIPNSVTSIGESTFEGCSGLTFITIPNDVTSIGSSAFKGCSGLTSIIIPNSVTSIGESTFEGCSGLTFITIPNSVTSIGRSAFEGCVGLTSVNIPNAVTSIGDKAFYGCPLDSVTIINGVTIGNGAFVGCHKAILHCNYVGDDYFHYVVEEREDGYFDNDGHYVPERYYWSIDINNSLRELEIGKEVISVGSNAFAGCDALEKVVFHCKEIGSNWFGSWVAYYVDYYEGYHDWRIHTTRKNQSLKEIIIGDEVTTIGEDAFIGCGDLTSVNIPNDVTYIGDKAFADCYYLTSVNIPNGVTYIGDKAFSGCPLDSVTIPNSVTNIGRGAFSNCQKATFHCKEIRDGWFDYWHYDYWGDDCDWYECFIKGFWDYNTSIKKIVIGDEVTTIGEYAFAGCQKLNTITIGDNVTSIGERAFSLCPLVSVTIPDNVTSVGRGAFSNCRIAAFHCKEIRDSWFDNYVWDSEEWDFYTTYSDYNDNCDWFDEYINNGYWEQYTTLQTIFIGDEVTTIGENAFSDCQELTSVTIGDNVTSIGEKAFNGCPFPSITIPNSVTNIGRGAFEECNNLATVTINSNYLVSQDYSMDSSYPFLSMFGKQVKKYIIGNDVKNIGQKAFYNCSELTSLTIGDNVTGIGESAFSDCNSLPSVVIPNNVIIIGDSAFNQCNGLTSLILGENVTSIGESAFYGCSGIPSLTIPNSVASIGSSAFSGCSGFTSLTIPNSVISIGESAFSGCNGITSMIIGDHLTSIGANAFAGCSVLKAVKSEGMTPASISDNSAFPNRADIVLCVPKGSKPLYGSAYCWKDFKAIKEITDGDVNVDNETDVIDVVDIARFVVGTPSESFVEFLADLNYDDNVNIADAVTLVNEIAGDQNFAKPYHVKPQSESHDVLTLTEKADGSLALNLENQRGYTAFQFDIFLPEGVDITEIALNGSRRQQHQLLYNKVDEGHYKVAALSTSNRTFSGSKGELLGFITDSSIHEDIVIDDIHFFTPDGQDYLFDAVSLSGTTGIETFAVDKEPQNGEHPTLYDLQGRKVLSPAGRKGIYIVNGKKVVIK